MTTHWISENGLFDELILAGDIGGTNTSFALVGRKARKFTVLGKFMFRSRKIDGLEAPIRQVLEAISAKTGKTPRKCCLSGAGPVVANTCRLSNLPWIIDGNGIEGTIGIGTIVINDFMAISYGLSLLDVHDPSQITPLPHPDGSLPEPHGPVRAVVGAGTGLGVGYLADHEGKFIAYASEGGHSDFAPFDDETRALEQFLEERYGTVPGAEAFVSGQGIANIYSFYRKDLGDSVSPLLVKIDEATDTDKPAIISEHAGTDDTCRRVMELFIRMYGKFAAKAALFYFPDGGMYIAGGIASKNEHLLLKDNLFMRSFELNYREHISAMLKTFPVYIVKDYAVSLYGAAQAAYSLL